MKQWWKRAGALLLAVAVLTVSAGQALAEEHAVDPVQQGIRAASEAAPDLVKAAAGGDLEAFRAAYERFAAAFEPVLGPISAVDPSLAARMASASSAIRYMLTAGLVAEEDVAREVAVIQGGLEEAAAVMARAAEPVERITVVAREYRFTPATLRVKAGRKVVVRLENRGREYHEFRVPELNILIGPIAPGKSAEAEFVVEKPGAYRYDCDVDRHDQKGMQGTLVVEE
ncbi:cupredoxin domain-containing protein [Symbiobacterium terraclitae]|uniref:cupredoxin domain-containing protein n=1 Tax=Symbiobacterium terraclitae TaxID=557451 RepID=UPI0035B568E8